MNFFDYYDEYCEFRYKTCASFDEFELFKKGEKSFASCVLDNWDKENRKRYAEQEYRRRTYESVSSNSILSSLGRTEKRYSREMKKSAIAWQNDSSGACEVYYVRTETIYEAYSEYVTEREYW